MIERSAEESSKPKYSVNDRDNAPTFSKVWQIITTRTLLSGPRSLPSLWSPVLSGGYPSLWFQVPSQPLVPCPFQGWGYLSPGQGGTPVLTGWGVPRQGIPNPGLGLGYPPGQDMPRTGYGASGTPLAFSRWRTFLFLKNEFCRDSSERAVSFL